MTLIIKELIIKGIVTTDATNATLDTGSLQERLEQMEKSIKKDCIEAVLSKLNSKNKR